MKKNTSIYSIAAPDEQRYVAKFKWTVSRARDTYRYNVVTLYVDGIKVASTCGGGYDMQGTVLANYIETIAQDDLRHLTANYGSSTPDNKGFYGLQYWNTKTKKRQRRYSKNCIVTLNGGCGFSSIERIMDRIGYSIICMD